MNSLNESWQPICSRAELIVDSGVVAWLVGVQIALFYLPNAQDQQLFAVDNRDPRSGANVIGRGIIGQLGNELMVALQLYKQHFRLADGSGMEYPDQRLKGWPVRLNGEVVEIAGRQD